MIRTRIILISSLSLIFFFFFAVSSVKAFSFDDIVKSIQQVFKPPAKTPPPALSVDSKISLAEDGDVNKNGQIDAGDTVRFSYTVTNTTDKDQTFATLKTNINRKQLNFIH